MIKRELSIQNTGVRSSAIHTRVRHRHLGVFAPLRELPSDAVLSVPAFFAVKQFAVLRLHSPQKFSSRLQVFTAYYSRLQGSAPGGEGIKRTAQGRPGQAKSGQVR